MAESTFILRANTSQAQTSLDGLGDSFNEVGRDALTAGSEASTGLSSLKCQCHSRTGNGESEKGK